MTANIKLTDTQLTVLLLAAERPDGNIEPMPAQLKGGARKKVIDGLLGRGLIKSRRKSLVLTEAGYGAVGRSPAQATSTDQAQEKQARTRDNSKQAQVIAMLKRPEGATIAQICSATGWQAHTVRGTFAGAFKKKLGLDITSTKEAGAERIYKIAS